MRAWCPECYREMDTTGTFGEQLLWCIRPVEACPRHHCLLETMCPYCHQPLRQLYAGSRVGRCFSCGTELRCTVADKTDKTLGDAPTKYQLWVADAVGQLLAHAPKMHPETLAERVRTVLTHYVQEFGGGNCAAVAEIARCHVGVFYEWLYGRTKPQIENLLQAWYHLNLPVSLIFSPNKELLQSEEGNPTQVKAEDRQNVRTRRRSRERIPGTPLAQQKTERIAAIEPTFQRALHENPPPPIHEVCKRIGLSPSRIKVLAPALCARFNAWRRECAEGRRAGLLNKLKAVLYETPPPAASEVYMRLGITQSIAIHNFPELRRAIIVRHRQYRHQKSCDLQKTAREEIRKIIQTLNHQGVCPSAMRVWGLAKKKSFLKWGAFVQAVHDARKSLNKLT